MKTKKTLYMAILAVLLVSLSGCAKKRKIVYVPMSPEMSKSDVKETERTAVIRASQVELKDRFNLSCPLGGEEDVVIHPALGREYNYWRRGGVSGFLLRRYVMVHRAKNPYTNMTLNITNGGERIVSNLCPGGSITLVQSMPPFVGGDYMRVIWTAEGRVDGRLAYSDSSPGVLYQGWHNAEAEARRPSWVMNLKRIDREF